MIQTGNEWTETLKDGRRALIRPIRRDDIDRVKRFLAELSPPSKHFLFLGGVAHLTDDALRKLAEPDYATAMVFVALDPGSGHAPRQIGVCRYAGGDSPDGAEISVAVADDWQRLGLGRRLLHRLIDHARAHGVKRLYSMDSIGNSRMRKLAGNVGFSEKPDPDDASQVICYLDLGGRASRSPRAPR
jgi:GNAT superfamily N-acetyltransferase